METCDCGQVFNPLMPMQLYGNEFYVNAVLCCPDCTRVMLAELNVRRGA